MAEDLAEATFAGQQDTFLNVLGKEALLDAVQRCWASLWTDRAIACRQRQGVDQQTLALAIVVQRLIAAESAGVLFTANPISGARDGLSAAAALREQLPACRVIIVTTFGRSGYLRQAMEDGAVGFLLKDAPAAELAGAIRRVMAGERVVDPEPALSALSEGDSPLTPRKRDVLSASLDGASVADIAARFYLSEGTVRNHLSTAIQKLGAHNRVEAARLAQGKG
jgi:DNA-binding NarL/FixJ family response regulator